MHWYELVVYGISACSVVVSLAIGVLAWQYFREH